MIINLNNDVRKDYLRDRTAYDILRTVIPKDRITIEDVKMSVKEGNIVILTDQMDFNGFVDENYSFNLIKNTENLANAKQDIVYLLPRQYGKTGNQSRHMTVYGIANFYLSMDSANVIQYFLGEERARLKGPLSSRIKQEVGWVPSIVYKAGFKFLRDNLQKAFDANLVGVRWRNTRDKRMNLLTPTRAIEGLEGRVLQDIAFYKVGLPKLKRGYCEDSCIDIDSKIKRCEREIGDADLGTVLDRLDLTENDLVQIEYVKADGLFSWCTVPSSDGTKRYDVQIWNMPAVKEGDKAAVSLPWDIEGYSTNPDKYFREGWSLLRPGPGHCFFDKSFLTAVFSHQARVNRHPELFNGKKVGELPFFIPRLSGMNMYHTLKYYTLVLDINSDGSPELRPMKHVEIDIELMRHAILFGFDSCYFTDTRQFVRKTEDPIIYAAQFIQ